MALIGGSIRRISRRLLRTPLFTAVTVLTLGVGIGATTAIFSVVYGVLLKPLPYPDPDRLVGLWHTAPGMNIPRLNMSPSTYFIYRESGRAFEDVAMWTRFQASITGRGEPERVAALAVTEGTLPILGVQPLLGRLFNRDDMADKAPARTVLTHGYWQRRFGAAGDVLGRSLTIDGKSHEIIGVLPASFKFLDENRALLMPLQFNRADLSVGNFSYQGFARLKPGVTLEQANQDIARMIPFQVEQYKLPAGFTRKMFDDIRMAPNLNPLSRDVVGDVGQVLWVLLGTVGLVLLIACANVANLFLVRAEGRQQEFALRGALGASRMRVAREVLAESVTLALAGGVLGLLLARAGIALLIAIAPGSLPRIDEIGIDVVVLLFALGISVLTGLLFGLVPVLRFGTPSIAALKEGGRSTSEGPGRHRARNALVVAEIALALVLLVVSGLMVRTFVALRQVEPGFVRPEEVQTFRVSVPVALIADEQAVRTHQQIAERLAQVAGVTRVGLGSSITMDGQDSNDPIFVEDRPTTGGEMPPIRRFKWIGPGYFETMGNRIVAGRALTWMDSYSYAQVVVVSENFAREFWKEPAAAIGRRIRQSPGNPWREIVGVVGDERDDGLNQAAPTIVYWPMLIKEFWDQKVFAARNISYAVRTPRVGSATLQRELQQAVWSVNPNLPLASVRTLDEIRSDSMGQTTFALVMLAIAASVALLLGVVGIYGVIAYIAAQRTREIGIRMALGAQAMDVSRLFIRHGLWLTGAGVLLGVVVSLGLTRLMSALLFGVSATDVATYLAVSSLLAVVALLATYLPARRASRIDPIVALRTDV